MRAALPQNRRDVNTGLTPYGRRASYTVCVSSLCLCPQVDARPDSLTLSQSESLLLSYVFV